MKFEGKEQFDCGPQILWSYLADTSFVCRVIPDVDQVLRLDERSLTCKVRPKFSFLSGSLELMFEILEQDAPTRLTIRSRGKGIGAAVVVEAEIRLSPHGPGTELAWQGTIVSREGLLKPIGSTLIQAAAQRVIENFWKNFRAALSSPPSIE